MNNRLKYIDVYKGMLMILVIIGHFHFFEYDSRTLTLIYSFHMPAFLIIGGYLSNIKENSSVISIIDKRFTNTIIPYFIFYTISLVILSKPTGVENQFAVLTMFKGIGDPINSVNLPLWFLTFYFVAMTLFEVLDLISIYIAKESFNNNKNIKNIILLLFVGIFMWIAYIYARIYKLERLPFNIEIAMFCLLYVYIGKMIKEYENVLKKIFSNTLINKKYYILLIIIYLILTYIWYNLSLKNGRIDLNARDYKNAFYMYINAILGFIMFCPIVYIVSIIPIINNIVSFFGMISLYILAYHIPSNIVTYGIINNFMPIIILKSLNSVNLISISYLTFNALLFSVFMYCIHKSIKSLIRSIK